MVLKQNFRFIGKKHKNDFMILKIVTTEICERIIEFNHLDDRNIFCYFSRIPLYKNILFYKTFFNMEHFLSKLNT